MREAGRAGRARWLCTGCGATHECTRNKGDAKHTCARTHAHNVQRRAGLALTHALEHAQAYLDQHPMGAKLMMLWRDFYANYKAAVLGSRVPGADEKLVAQVQASIADNVLLQFADPYTFPSLHQRMVTPEYSYFEFGQRYVASLTDFANSVVGHRERWDRAAAQVGLRCWWGAGGGGLEQRAAAAAGVGRGGGRDRGYTAAPAQRVQINAPACVRGCWDAHACMHTLSACAGSSGAPVPPWV